MGIKAAFGDAIHDAIEAWSRDGTLPDPSDRKGALLRDAVRALSDAAPPPRSEAELEGWITPIHLDEYEGGEGVQLIGKKDASKFTLPEPDDPSRANPCIQDYKSTSAKKYAKTEAELLTDQQAVIYAWSESIDTASARIHLRWVYLVLSWPTLAKLDEEIAAGRPPLPTKIGKRHNVERVIDVDDPEWLVARDDVIADAIAMAKHKRAKTDPDELQPHPDACQAFGRPCPHLQTCDLTTAQRVDALFAKRSDPPEGKKSLTVLGAAGDNEHSTTNKGAPMSLILERLKASKAKAAAEEAGEETTEVVANEAKEPTEVLDAGDPVSPNEKEVKPVAEKKPPRKRAKKDPTPAPGNNADAQAMGAGSLVALIDCAAVKLSEAGPSTSLADVVAAAAAALVTDDRPHWSVTMPDDKTHFVDRRGCLIAEVTKRLEGMEGFVVANSRDPDQAAVLGALESTASVVLRGMM